MSELSVDIDMEVLAAFYKAGGEAIGVTDLMKSLGCSLVEVGEKVDRLRAAGYVIGKSHPYGSTAFQMLEIPDRLYVHELTRRISTEWLGREIRSYNRLPSTNRMAQTLAAEGARHGMIVLAEEQTEGRGRAGRVWHSVPRRGIYVSAILRPAAPVAPAALSVATAVGVAHTAMKLTGKRASLRWPNDVLMSRGKVAGILAELQDGGPIVVGIGLNVGHEPSDFPPEFREEASSLSMETGHPLSRLPVLPTLLATLEEWYDHLFAGDFETIAGAWRPLSLLLDREVVVYRGERKTEGTVKDLSPERGVLVSSADGEEWIPAEHVTFIRAVDGA